MAAGRHPRCMKMKRLTPDSALGSCVQPQTNPGNFQERQRCPRAAELCCVHSTNHPGLGQRSQSPFFNTRSSDTICAMRRYLVLAGVLAFSALAVEQNDVEFARPGGFSLTLDLKTPEGNGPFPAAIIVHGGSFSHGHKR